MNTYSAFVNQIYELITAGYDSGNPIHYFCNGPAANRGKCSYDYAMLEGKAAHTFGYFALNNLKLLGITENDLDFFMPPSQPEKLKINISCYPKNLRRWMQGTLSRKNKCRAEFCLLIWCHACGWDFMKTAATPGSTGLMTSAEQERIRKGLLQICKAFIEQEESCDDMSLELLVKASNAAYRRSLK